MDWLAAGLGAAASGRITGASVGGLGAGHVDDTMGAFGSGASGAGFGATGCTSAVFKHFEGPMTQEELGAGLATVVGDGVTTAGSGGLAVLELGEGVGAA